MRKSYKIRDLSSILLPFRNELTKFNNTGGPMLDFIYHRTMKLMKNRIFGMKRQDFATFYATLYNGRN